MLDASVGIKLFVDEAGSDDVREWVAGLSDDVVPLVPDLFFVECANILWKYVRRAGMSQDTATETIAKIVDLPLEQIPTQTLAPEALKLAIKHGVSAYDGCYLALAAKTGAAHVTADQRLKDKVANSSLRIVLVGAN